MLPRHHLPALLTLASTLLIAACGVAPNVNDSDTGTSEETETGFENNGECVFDGSDSTSDAQPQPLVLTNSGPTPLFVVPPGCVHIRVFVDTVEYRLATRLPCANVLLGSIPCYDSCDGNLLTPPIRVDPGASFEWPFSGYVWSGASIPASCHEDCSQPEFGSCGIGHVVEPGALVEFEVYVRSECGLEQCECPPGETACMLGGNTDGGEGGLSNDVPISFTHGSADPVIIDLAG
jgi:hypothetical protein